MSLGNLFRSAVLLSAVSLGTAHAQSVSSGNAGAPPRTEPASAGPAFLTEPALIANANPGFYLTASIEFKTDVPTQVSLSIDDGVDRWLLPLVEPEFKTDHDVWVLGLKPDRTNEITVLIRSMSGVQSAASEPVVFVTQPLPPGFPPIAVNRADTGAMEPGYTMLSPRSTGGGMVIDQYHVFLDSQGEVVWYADNHQIDKVLRNGAMLGFSFSVYREVDLMGNILGQWYPGRLDGGAGAPAGSVIVDTDSIHHDMVQLPEEADADFAALSSELRHFPNYPQDEFNQGTFVPANVVGDVIVEFNRDGTIVREKNLLDILDPFRIAYDQALAFWWGTYEGAMPRDWTHGNSLMYDPSDDTYILSLRHQDCIVKIRRSTPGTGSFDDLVWILGNHDGWLDPWRSKLLQPIGLFSNFPSQEIEGFEWPYHQHAAFLNHTGNLTCFDNGNFRAHPPMLPDAVEADWYSRAVEYKIDPVAMTVEQVWAAGGQFDPDPYRIGYAFFVSGTQHLEQTGNVLVCAGGKREIAGGPHHTHVMELTHTDPPAAVFDVVLREPDDAVNWATYRAVRVPSLYPGFAENFSADELELTVGPVEQGESVELRVDVVGRRGETVYFVRGDSEPTLEELNGAANGPTGHFVLGRATVGPDGTATLRRRIHELVAGEPVHFRAYLPRAEHQGLPLTSNSVRTRVEAP